MYLSERKRQPKKSGKIKLAENVFAWIQSKIYMCAARERAINFPGPNLNFKGLVLNYSIVILIAMISLKKIWMVNAWWSACVNIYKIMFCIK